MLSMEEIKELGRVARVSLDEEETKILCRDLNALLEMASVLETLPKDERDSRGTAALRELREDKVIFASDFAEAGKSFSVPPVMEKS